jgi:Rhesus blood group glycoprotein
MCVIQIRKLWSEEAKQPCKHPDVISSVLDAILSYSHFIPLPLVCFFLLSLCTPPPCEVLQDFTIMAALGLGFLPLSLRRLAWSSVGFNFFLLALGVQWAILLDGVLDQPFFGKVIIKLSR